MSAKIIPIDSKLQAAWSEVVESQKRAKATGSIEDGIAAGKAWRRWLDLFITPEQRKAIGGER